MKYYFKTKRLCIAALFVAIGIILPFFTMQIKTIGKMLLPMHFPVLLCGLLLNGVYGLIVGIVTPLLRSMIFGMPVFFPDAISMSVELGTYGLVSGLMIGKSKNKSLGRIYLALIVAMICGRVMLAIMKIILLGAANNSFSLMVFLNQSVLTGFPGIVIQLVLIPIIVKILEDKL